jgi:hypothetical protein
MLEVNREGDSVPFNEEVAVCRMDSNYCQDCGIEYAGKCCPMCGGG